MPPSDTSQIKISLAGKSLRHDQSLAVQGLHPYQTLCVDTPALLGGMINDSDTSFKRASFAAVDEEEKAPLASPTGTSLNTDWANCDTKRQFDLNSSQISLKFAERFTKGMAEMVAALPEDDMTSMHEELSMYQDWYDPLSDERKKLACGIFVSALSIDKEAKKFFDGRSKQFPYLMEILNSDR